MVKKGDNTRRFCIDFRRLNAVTEKDAYPLPHVHATLDKLQGAQFLTILDLKSGYWQIPLSKESQLLTAFTVPGRGTSTNAVSNNAVRTALRCRDLSIADRSSTRTRIRTKRVRLFG